MEKASKQSLLKRAVAALHSSNGIHHQNGFSPSLDSQSDAFVHSSNIKSHWTEAILYASGIERPFSAPPTQAAVARIAVSLPESEASKLDQVSDTWRKNFSWSLESGEATSTQSSLSQIPRSTSTAPTSQTHRASQLHKPSPLHPRIPSFSYLQSQSQDDTQDSEDNEIYLHLREVVEARRDGGEAKSSAAFKAISQRLRAMPKISSERAEILGESGFAFFWRAKRAMTAGIFEEGHMLAKQAIVYLNTALKIQTTLSDINPYLYLRLGQCNEMLGPDRHDAALEIYTQGLSTAGRGGPVAKKLSMARLQLFEYMGEKAKASEALHEMTTIWPADDVLQMRLAKVLLSVRPLTVANVRSAVCCVDEAILLDPDNPEYIRLGNSIQSVLEDISRPTNHILGGERASVRHQTPSDVDYGEIAPPDKTVFEGTNSGPSFWQALRSKSPILRPRSRASNVSSSQDYRQQASHLPPQMPAPFPQHLPEPRFRPKTTSPLAGLSGKLSSSQLKPRARSVRDHCDPDQQVFALQENMSHHTHILTDQVARMSAAENSIDGIMTRLAALETGTCIQEIVGPDGQPHDQRPIMGRRATRTSAPNLSRPMSVPPSTRPFQLENLSQEELLERSVMLYGVWAMEKMLSKSPGPE